MTLPPEYLEYPYRRHGMDQDRYDWSMLPARKPIVWPQGARVALWVVPVLEWFPLDMVNKPFAVPGALEQAYPDYRIYTLRDYGNRVGVFRLFKAFQRLGIKATVAMNAEVAKRYPFLVQEVNRHGWEVAAAGLDMGHPHHGGLEYDAEVALVEETLRTLRLASGQPVTGWLSPGNSESHNTPDIVAAHGIQYLCDWVNDDLPYEFRTASGPIHAMPYTHEISDRTVCHQMKGSVEDYAQQILDQFDLLYREAAKTGGGRVMTIVLHPWVSGVPHRIAGVVGALEKIMSHGGVWSATGDEIMAAFKAQAQVA